MADDAQEQDRPNTYVALLIIVYGSINSNQGWVIFKAMSPVGFHFDSPS